MLARCEQRRVDPETSAEYHLVDNPPPDDPAVNPNPKPSNSGDTTPWREDAWDRPRVVYHRVYLKKNGRCQEEAGRAGRAPGVPRLLSFSRR